jgi:tRNA(Ile)-lysidine synthase
MNPTLKHELERKAMRAWPTESWRDSHVVLAVSAGPDSVAMLRAALTAKSLFGGRGQLLVAHFNHGMRGADADTDQGWVEALCRQLNLPLETARADAATIAATSGYGWEAAARIARYEFLTRTAETHGARFVAVAHTADDQMETVLHRILRGTGLAGLAGMRFSRPLSPSVTLVRPLLAARRREVLGYLQAICQDFRTDHTNSDTRWTRNRLRHELLPLLRDRYNSGVDDALLRLAVQADEAQQVIAGVAEQLAGEYVVVDREPQLQVAGKPLRVSVDSRQLQVVPVLLIREVCRVAWRDAGWPMQAMGFDEWQAVAELVQGTREAPVNLPGGVRARRDSGKLVLDLIDSVKAGPIGC